MATYIYIIDLDERGIFYAHVEDNEGRTIFSFNNEDSIDGELWLIEDGFMKHSEDIANLELYLKQMGFIGENDELVM